MIEIIGDLWDFHGEWVTGEVARPWLPHGKAWAVVTTNGYINRSREEPECIMGAGSAKGAKIRFPRIPVELARRIIKTGNETYIWEPYMLATVPSKHQWFNKLSDLDLIETSVRQLVERIPDDGKPVYMVRPGCGKGERSWEREVRPLISPLLSDRFIVVDLGVKPRKHLNDQDLLPFSPGEIDRLEMSAFSYDGGASYFKPETILRLIATLRTFQLSNPVPHLSQLPKEQDTQPLLF